VVVQRSKEKQEKKQKIRSEQKSKEHRDKKKRTTSDFSTKIILF
jgi:hypothetical protein